MTSAWQRQTGKLIGPRFNQHPMAGRRRAAVPAEDSTRPADVMQRDLRALEEMQAKRPMKPVGKR